MTSGWRPARPRPPSSSARRSGRAGGGRAPGSHVQRGLRARAHHPVDLEVRAVRDQERAERSSCRCRRPRAGSGTPPAATRRQAPGATVRRTASSHGSPCTAMSRTPAQGPQVGAGPRRPGQPVGQDLGPARGTSRPGLDQPELQVDEVRGDGPGPGERDGPLPGGPPAPGRHRPDAARVRRIPSCRSRSSVTARSEPSPVASPRARATSTGWAARPAGRVSGPPPAWRGPRCPVRRPDAPTRARAGRPPAATGSRRPRPAALRPWSSRPARRAAASPAATATGPGQYSSQEVEARLRAAGISADRVRRINEVVDGAAGSTVFSQMAERRVGSMRTTKLPFTLSSVDLPTPASAPSLGEHSGEVLRARRQPFRRGY